MQNPDCYKCKYRHVIPGSSHSKCDYPGNTLNLLSMFGLFVPENANNGKKLNIQADGYGFLKGWFNWPVNYDPVWLRNCDGFEGME